MIFFFWNTGNAPSLLLMMCGKPIIGILCYWWCKLLDICKAMRHRHTFKYHRETPPFARQCVIYYIYVDCVAAEGQQCCAAPHRVYGD